MADPGDRLLFALSAWGSVRYGKFKELLLELGAQVQFAEDVEEDRARRQRRYDALTALVALGHADLRSDEKGTSIWVAPSTLALLPLPGLPRAVLCGARSPHAAIDLASSCPKSKCHVRVASQKGRLEFAPSRLEIEAESVDALEALAGSLGIGFTVVPPAWALAEAAGTLEGYLSMLTWREEPELDWERQDFLPEKLGFSGAGSSGSGLRLSRYRHPSRPLWRFRLWRDGGSAEVDLNWGRYTVLRDAGVQVFHYCARSGSFRAPAVVPLPVPLSRALALSSGLSPRRNAKSLEIVYEGVPIDVAAAVAGKLGQELVGHAGGESE